VISYHVNYESVKTWKNITLNLSGKNLDGIIDKLMELDILSITVTDKRNTETSDWFHFNDKPIKIHGDTHYLILLVENNYPTEKLIHEISKILNISQPIEYFEDKFQDTDWVRETQIRFNEIKISKTLRIVPPWKIDDSFEGQTIIIDPGNGFGTGSHPTTKLCLGWLENNFKRYESFLDYGTGSGILSIAAKALGVENITGVDIDSKAIENANYNSQLNGYNISFLDLNYNAINQSFDTVVSNILSSTLIALSPIFEAITIKRLALCGILDKQVDPVITAFSNWIQLKPEAKSKGWNLLLGKL